MQMVEIEFITAGVDQAPHRIERAFFHAGLTSAASHGSYFRNIQGRYGDRRVKGRFFP